MLLVRNEEYTDNSFRTNLAYNFFSCVAVTEPSIKITNVSAYQQDGKSSQLNAIATLGLAAY
jgi:hypothetical protein